MELGICTRGLAVLRPTSELTNTARTGARRPRSQHRRPPSYGDMAVLGVTRLRGGRVSHWNAAPARSRTSRPAVVLGRARLWLSARRRPLAPRSSCHSCNHGNRSRPRRRLPHIIAPSEERQQGSPPSSIYRQSRSSGGARSASLRPGPYAFCRRATIRPR